MEATDGQRRRRNRPARASTTTSAWVPARVRARSRAEEYAANVAKVIRFLSGKHDELEGELGRQMRTAAEQLDFETAARHRNRLEAVQSIRERQKVVSGRPLNMDVIGFHREETVAGVHLFVVREGRVLYGNEFVLDKGLDVSMDELVDGVPAALLLRCRRGAA